MEFTEQTIMEFFRRVGQPSAAYRLLDHLKAEDLMLVKATAFELILPDHVASPANGKRAGRDRR